MMMMMEYEENAYTGVNVNRRSTGRANEQRTIMESCLISSPTSVLESENLGAN